MKKYKIQSKQKDKIFKTNFSENLKGMSLIEALIIFTLRHSYGVIKKNLKPINYNENQNSKIKARRGGQINSLLLEIVLVP